ncbi:MAG: hypothetical protein FJW34_15165 [Acidobacteria bacterium]|nr:hypothetical protein [Acidobacteriota bacterium]
MKLGAERKKVALLAVLLAVAGYLGYSNLLVSDEGPPATARTPARPGVEATVRRELDPAPVSEARPATSPRTRSLEFRPSLRRSRPEEGIDPFSADPTLRLDLLAKVQAVRIEGGERNLFQFGPPPAPKVIEPKIVPKPVAPPPENKTAEEPSKPPPTPIPLKFYGYSSEGRSGPRRAFFLDGDEILMAPEGELLKRRYKVVRIGVNSCVVEDVEQKHQQTLPLEEQTG